MLLTPATHIGAEERTPNYILQKRIPFNKGVAGVYIATGVGNLRSQGFTEV
jgi:hypothetical protein